MLFYTKNPYIFWRNKQVNDFLQVGKKFNVFAPGLWYHTDNIKEEGGARYAVRDCFSGRTGWRHGCQQITNLLPA